MKDRINDTISKYNMISDGDSIIVGLSGGADSVALTHFLAHYKEKKNIKVIAAHINHCIRGEEADRDEEFVKNFCNKLGIKLFAKRVKVIELAKERGIGLEECGRSVRYEYFKELSHKFNGKIATAHSLSDSEETVILNIARGCGLKGVCGIPPIRDKIIRPLIFISRGEIERYCKKNNLSFVTDSTNLTEDYTRNKVRINVVPVLKDINGSFDNTFRRMIIQNMDEENYLNSLAEKELQKAKLSDGYSIIYLQNINKTLRNRIVKKILESYCESEVESKHIKFVCDIIDNMSGAVTLPKNVNICVDGLKLIKKEHENKTHEFEYKFLGTNVLTESNVKFIIEILRVEDYNNIVRENKIKNYVVLDNDAVPSNAVFRNRRQGDKFCQKGRGVTKKVKKLFNELKIPENNRNSKVMLAVGSKVLWIDGVGISESCKVKENTKSVVVIRREVIND